MKTTSKALGIAAGTLIALSTATASAQSSGVSHPDETVIQNTPDAAPPQIQPNPAVDPSAQSTGNYAVLNPTPNQARAFGPAGPAPRTQPIDPDAGVIGDEQPYAAQPYAAQPYAAQPYAAQPRTQPADLNDGVVVRVAGPSNRLPEGTLVTARLLQSLSTRTTQEGTAWTAELVEPLTRDGRVLIPAGALLSGKVTEVRGGKHFGGKAAIYLATVAIALPDGTSRGLHAQLIDTSLTHTIKVDQEGTVLQKPHRKEEAGVFALTAGGGAAAGALLAGPAGAVVGAGIGAGVGGVVWLKQDKQAELPKNTRLTFELTRSMGFDGADPSGANR